MIEQSEELKSGIRFLSPLSFTKYVKLQMEAALVVSDSGTINEEASILGFSAINMREAHERPEASEVGVTVLTGHDPGVVALAAEVALNQYCEPPPVVADYDMTTTSSVVVKTIMGYTSYVRREKGYDLFS